MRDLGSAGTIARVDPGGADGVVDGNDVVEADKHFSKAEVSFCGVPALGEEALVEGVYACWSEMVRSGGQADNVFAADVLGEIERGGGEEVLSAHIVEAVIELHNIIGAGGLKAGKAG